MKVRIKKLLKENQQTYTQEQADQIRVAISRVMDRTLLKPTLIFSTSLTRGPYEILTAFLTDLPKPQPGINNTPAFINTSSTNFPPSIPILMHVYNPPSGSNTGNPRFLLIDATVCLAAV